MTDASPKGGRRIAPPTPLNRRPVNRAALAVLQAMKVRPDPSRLHLVTLLVEALELEDPGPGVPAAEWAGMPGRLYPLLLASPEEALRWWTSNPNLPLDDQEADLTAVLRLAETPTKAMWAFLEVTRDRLRAQAMT
jgi:hypothetical protein